MGRRLPDEVVYRIRVRIEAGERVPAIAKAIQVAHRTVYKIQVNLDLYGEPYAPASVVQGRPRLLLAYQELKLLDFLEDQPTAYLDELQDFLFDEFDLQVSTATVSRTLLRARWSRKAVRARAAERSHELRTLWIGRQANWSADQLLFLDESACNERTGDRKFGWSPIGIDCAVSRSAKRSERWSILPALSVDGYLSYLIYQGSITAEIFELFVEQQVLPHCTPYPRPRSILVLDNASIHKSVRLRNLCEEYGILLVFLPPYSPDFNPIEATFKDLKAWVKRNYRLAEEFNSFEAFLHFAVSQSTGEHARTHYREAGYIIN